MALGVRSEAFPRTVQLATRVTLVVLLARVHVYVLFEHVAVLKDALTVRTLNAVLCNRLSGETAEVQRYSQVCMWHMCVRACVFAVSWWCVR